MLSEDKQFAERVLLLARQYGWSGDYIEVAEFVQWIFRQYGLVVPTPDELEPIER